MPSFFNTAEKLKSAQMLKEVLKMLNNLAAKPLCLTQRFLRS